MTLTAKTNKLWSRYSFSLRQIFLIS